MRWFGTISPRRSNQKTDRPVSTLPLSGIGVGWTASYVEIRSLATSSRRSPRSYSSRTLPEAMRGRSARTLTWRDASSGSGAKEVRQPVARERPLLGGGAVAGVEDRQQRKTAHGAECHLDERIAGAVLGSVGEHLAAAQQRPLAEPRLDRRERRAQLLVRARGGGEVDRG